MDTSKEQIKLLDKYIRRLISLYKTEYIAALDEIKGLVLEVYSQIIVEGTPLLSHLYQFRRYYKLTKDIQKILTKLGVKQEQLFSKELETYYEKNAAILNDQFETPFGVTDREVRNIVSNYITDYTLWSDSIWRDKAVLLNKIRHQLVMNAAAGKSIDQMADDLKAENITGNFYNAKRLVRQELQRFYRKTTVDSYKKAGITEVQWHEVMDERTCEECKKHNDEIIAIDKVPLGGWHIQCRGFITAVVE